ncbi:MAG: hypothetical protein ACK5V3_01730 [Bdellovibrionales bacterium]
MNKFIFVTLLLGQSVHANSLNWPKNVVQQQNKKTLSQVCEAGSERLQTKLCKTFKKDEIKNTDKIKITLEDSRTASINWNMGNIKLRRTEELGTVLVNRKVLYLEEISSFKDLKDKLTKLLSPEDLAALPAALTFLYQSAEHETCDRAEKVVQSCLKVEEIIALNRMKKTMELAEVFSSQINFLSPSKKDSLESCQCNKGLCGFTKNKKMSLKMDYDTCQKRVKEFAKKSKAEKWEDETFVQFRDAITQLPKKERPRQPAQFKEESFKE